MTPPREPENRPELPALITQIRSQKRRQDRFSLYGDETFLIGVSSESLLAFNLKKGMELTPALYEMISRQEREISLREYLIGLLGRRDHSAGELKRKAQKKGYRSDEIETVTHRLKSKGYLNEEEFARKFTSDKLRIQRWGPRRIRSELIRKGIDPEMAERHLKEQKEDLELNEICVDLALKRRRHFARERDEQKRKLKIAAYLQRRGFDFTTIKRALPDIIEQMNDS